MDLFRELFRMQAELNNKTFSKKGIKDNQGNMLSMLMLSIQAKAGPWSEDPVSANAAGKIGPNDEVNKWLINYLNADDAESGELREELLWKWWSKDFLDMQNIRVEIIDKLHFWISLAIVAGLDADESFRLYKLKNEVNLNRQDTGYSKDTKTEADNKGVK